MRDLTNSFVTILKTIETYILQFTLEGYLEKILATITNIAKLSADEFSLILTVFQKGDC